MKRFYPNLTITLLLLFVSCKKDDELFLQDKAYEFEKTFGTAGTDAFSALCVDGNHLICVGYTNGAGAGFYDGWVVKTNVRGEKISEKTFGGSDNDFLLSVVNTDDGNYLFTGYSHSNSAGQEDAWVLKTDKSLNLIWEKRFGGVASDLAINAVNDINGGYIVSASTQSKGQGALDHWLLKLDANGNLLKEKTFGEISVQGYAQIMQKSDGNYFLCGRTDKNGSADIDVIETNNNLDSLNEFIFGSTDYEEPKNIIELTDGSFLLGGHTASFGHPEHNFYAVKFKENGALIWENNYGSTQHDGAENICKISETSFLLTGRSNGNAANGEDLMYMYIDGNGNSTSSSVYKGSGGTDQGIQSIKNFMTLYTVGKKEVTAGNTDAWLIGGK